MDEQKQPTTNQSWHKVALILACFVAGFGGGWLAIGARDNAGGGSAQQVVLKESELISDVAERVSPSVISIRAKTRSVSNDLFFGPQVQEGESAGTGIIISDDGLVVTNKHVVSGSTAAGLSIVLSDGTEYDDIEKIGEDPFMDVAYLKIKGAKNLKAARLGDSSKMRVGDKVVAIGNALGEYDHTVTAGIISGTGRPVVAGNGSGQSEQLTNLFQTDAAINPGNSGGPLVNLSGEVIGINTAVASDSENIGFAIPINDVKPGMQSVREQGKLVRPYLGVRYVLLTEEIAKQLELKVEEGALVIGNDRQPAIVADSPADKAGIREDDVIVEIEGTKINESNGLVSVVSRYQVGESVTVKLLRDGRERDVEVKLEAVPDNLAE